MKDKKICKLMEQLTANILVLKSQWGSRPQQIKMVEQRKRYNVAGIVRIVEFQGDNNVSDSWNLVMIQKIEIKVVVPAGGIRFKRGDTCFMEFEPRYIHLFDETEKAIIREKGITSKA